MKETLAYNVLETMQWRYMQSLNAVDWWMKFGIKFYHYDGIWKRLSDLKKYGLVESKWNDEKGYMLYQVSEKWLCIKSMEEYALYINSLPKVKKTRAESEVKKECKDINDTVKKISYNEVCNIVLWWKYASGSNDNIRIQWAMDILRHLKLLKE